MRAMVIIFLVLVSGAALADDVAARVAWTRSTAIVEAIAEGEGLLEKALSYGDEVGYAREVARPMTRKLQWWRELEEHDPQQFQPYLNCLAAGAAFNHYGEGRWSDPSLSRDRLIADNQVRYKSALKDCKQALRKGTPRRLSN